MAKIDHANKDLLTNSKESLHICISDKKSMQA